MTEKSTWGGAGRGQGRHNVVKDEATVRVNVRLSQSQYDWLSSQGTVSDALRKLIQEAMQRESS